MLMLQHTTLKSAACALVVSVVALSPARSFAAGYNPSLVSSRVCAGADVIAVASNALQEKGVTTAHLINSTATVTIQSSTQGVTAHTDSGLSAEYLGSVTLPNSAACVTAPARETLAAHNNTISAPYIAAFNLVQSYRAAHLWPLGPANLNSPSTGVILENYGQRYVIVMLVDNSVKQDAEGKRILGCSGSEYYRVDKTTLVVSPFDGCVEGHQHVLPSFSQLP